MVLRIIRTLILIVLTPLHFCCAQNACGPIFKNYYSDSFIDSNVYNIFRKLPIEETDNFNESLFLKTGIILTNDLKEEIIKFEMNNLKLSKKMELIEGDSLRFVNDYQNCISLHAIEKLKDLYGFNLILIKSECTSENLKVNKIYLLITQGYKVRSIVTVFNDFNNKFDGCKLSTLVKKKHLFYIKSKYYSDVIINNSNSTTKNFKLILNKNGYIK